MILISADIDGSTLPNRYNRIKVNMMHMKEGDVCKIPFFSILLIYRLNSANHHSTNNSRSTF